MWFDAVSFISHVRAQSARGHVLDYQSARGNVLGLFIARGGDAPVHLESQPKNLQQLATEI